MERKFATSYIRRNDIASLTREAAAISGIQFTLDINKEEVETILQA